MTQPEIDRRRAEVLSDLAPAEETAIRVLDDGAGVLIALVSAPRAEWPRIKKSVQRRFGASTRMNFQE